MKYSRSEYAELIGAMPGDGSFMHYETLAGELGRETAEVVQMLWNLQAWGQIKLDIGCCLTRETINKLKEAKADGKH